MRLHHYFRSSASYRVRIALALKGLDAALVPVNLVHSEQQQPAFRALTAAELVPALEVDTDDAAADAQAASGPPDRGRDRSPDRGADRSFDQSPDRGPGSGPDRAPEPDGDPRRVLTQSLAIIEYLDEVHPEPPLLPGDALDRARIRSIAQDIGCDIHPLDNLRVLRYLVRDLGIDEDAKNRWYRHWVDLGLAALETRLAGDPRTGRYCHGDAPTLADCVLVPQIHNAQRFACRLDAVPTLMRIFETCMALPAFASTQPSAYPQDAA